ncbi:hypothetical protein V1512DRAFT_267251 [Lipomyces arxii]|uniref:uncharacterized protein n=1 Tax=Lipomyces arxii TaxID=56418 RepID=UPI0034CDB2A2
MAHEFVFDMKPKARDALVRPEAAVDLARSLVSEVARTWKRESAYPYYSGVQTYSRKLLGEKWVARISIHELPWDWFKAGICDDHTENELEYIDQFETYTEIDAGESGWKGIVAKYALSFPLSVRELPEWVLAVQPDPEIREFFVISVPAKCPISKGAVLGRYTSVEQVRELRDGRIEWTMAFTSDGGGTIPRWIQNLVLPSTTAKDVPSFIEWAKRKYAIE